MGHFTIGQIARRAGVGVQTIRYYEREGLLPEPPRRRSGYRSYDEGAVRRLAFIRRAKALCFSLREIRELFALRVDPTCTCGDVRRRALAKVADVEARIASLKRMHAALLALVTACAGDGPTSACPILDAMDGGEATDAHL